MLAVCSGLVGYLSVRAKNHSMATACFSLSAVSAMLAVVPFLSAILPMAPLISPGGGKTTASEPVEVDLALAIVSLLQVRVHFDDWIPSFPFPTVTLLVCHCLGRHCLRLSCCRRHDESCGGDAAAECYCWRSGGRGKRWKSMEQRKWWVCGEVETVTHSQCPNVHAK